MKYVSLSKNESKSVTGTGDKWMTILKLTQEPMYSPGGLFTCQRGAGECTLRKLHGEQDLQSVNPEHGEITCYSQEKRRKFMNQNRW